jgi:hypothetical protein
MRLNPGAFALADFLNSAREFRKSPGSASRDGDTRGIGAFQKSSVIGPLRGSFFLENGALRDTREKNPEIGSKKRHLTSSDVTLHYSSESNYKINIFGSKELAHKLEMLVWEGDQKHLPSLIIQTREEEKDTRTQ